MPDIVAFDIDDPMLLRIFSNCFFRPQQFLSGAQFFRHMVLLQDAGAQNNPQVLNDFEQFFDLASGYTRTCSINKKWVNQSIGSPIKRPVQYHPTQL